MHTETTTENLHERLDLILSDLADPAYMHRQHAPEMVAEQARLARQILHQLVSTPTATDKI